MPGADPRRFQSLLRAPSPRPAQDLMNVSRLEGLRDHPSLGAPADYTTAKMLAASLTDADAFAILGPRPAKHGAAYLPSEEERRMSAALRLLQMGHGSPTSAGIGSRLVRDRGRQW